MSSGAKRQQGEEAACKEYNGYIHEKVKTAGTLGFELLIFKQQIK